MEKKKLCFVIAIGVSIVLLVSLYVAVSRFNEEVLEFSESIDSGEYCETNGGKWIPKTRECEHISEEKCIDSGGYFQECASSCRNNPDKNVMCVMVCVPVCKY